MSLSTGKRIKASEVGGMASMYFPLRVNRSLRASFTFLKVLVRSYMMNADLTLMNIIGITSSTTYITGALLRAWKAAITSSIAPHASHAVFFFFFCQSGRRAMFDHSLRRREMREDPMTFLCQYYGTCRALATISGICQHQTQSKAWIRKCIGILQCDD